MLIPSVQKDPRSSVLTDISQTRGMSPRLTSCTYPGREGHEVHVHTFFIPTHIYIYIYICIYMYLYIPIYLPICLSVSLSISVYCIYIHICIDGHLLWWRVTNPKLCRHNQRVLPHLFYVATRDKGQVFFGSNIVSRPPIKEHMGL